MLKGKKRRDVKKRKGKRKGKGGKNERDKMKKKEKSDLEKLEPMILSFQESVRRWRSWE